MLYANTSYNTMSMLSLVPSLRVIHAYANTNNTIEICLKHATQIYQLPTIENLHINMSHSNLSFCIISSDKIK